MLLYRPRYRGRARKRSGGGSYRAAGRVSATVAAALGRYIGSRMGYRAGSRRSYGTARSTAMRRSYTSTRTRTNKRRRVSVAASHTLGDKSSGWTMSIHKRYPPLKQRRMHKMFDDVAPQKFLNGTEYVGFKSPGLRTIGDVTFHPFARDQFFSDFPGYVPNTDAKFLFATYQWRGVFANITTGVIKLTIYDCVVKNDTDTDTAELFKKGVNDKFQVAATGADYSNFYGLAPFMSEEFNRCYKVRNIKSVVLDPGQHHEHTYLFIANKIMHSGQLYQDGSASNYIAGLTARIMVIAEGGNVGAGTTGTNFTKAEARYSLTCTEIRTYRQALSNATVYKAPELYPTTIPVSNVINVTSGEKETIAAE